MSWKGDLMRAGIQSDGINLEADGHITAQGGINSGIGGGNIYFLDAENGADTNDGKTPDRAFASIAVAYAALDSNQNDVLYYLPSATAATIATALDWSKNYCHLIGLGAPVPVAQRRGIFNSGNLASLLTVSGSGNSFQNIYMFQGGATAASGNVIVTGSRNYFNNFHFAGIGHATPAGNVNAFSLKLTAAEENFFENCTIGIDTIKRTAANYHLVMEGQHKRNEFKNCRFLSAAEVNTYNHIKITGGDRYTFFDRPMFYNFWTNFVGTLLGAASITTTTTHYTLVKDPSYFAVLEFNAGDAAGTYVVGPAVGAGAGIAVPPTT